MSLEHSFNIFLKKKKSKKKLLKFISWLVRQMLDYNAYRSYQSKRLKYL